MRVYDPLELASPLTLVGKQIYRDACNSKISWDADLNEKLSRWEKWERSLPPEVVVPRSIVNHQEVTAIELHTFGDASIEGVGAAVHAVVENTAASGTTQQLVTAKSRLAKRSLTLPRLELVAAHMAANLAVNVSNALPKDQSPSIYAWVDSLVVLHWICSQGTYKQLVANGVAKIHAHLSVNPADIASRGGLISFSELWWK